MGKLIGLSQKLLWRHMKAMDLTILFVSMVIAVTCVTAISLFTDRIRQTMQQEASSFIAADAQVRGSKPLNQQWFPIAEELNLEQGFITSFNAVIVANDLLQFSSIKAVSDNYPLRGTVTVADGAFGSESLLTNGPKPGNIWIASRLFSLLDVNLGDQLQIGNASFNISKALITEPDSAPTGLSVGGKAIINIANLEETGVVAQGSRVSYRWLLNGSSADLETLQENIELDEHFRFVGVNEANQQVGGALDRAQSFFLLAGALALVLAGVAISLAASKYTKAQLTGVALLKSFGLTPKQILIIYAWQMMVIGVFSIAVGLFLGWAIHEAFFVLFDSFLPTQLAQASSMPYITGFLTGLLCLFAFAGPDFFRLRNIAPISILRELQASTSSMLINVGIGFVAVFALVWVFSQSWLITLALTGATVIIGIAISTFAWLILWMINPLVKRLGSQWRIGFAALKRRSTQNSMQIMMFSLALMLLFTLILLRTSLISSWQEQLPQEADNHYVFNVFNDELQGLDDWQEKYDIKSSPKYPMIRGRLVEHNQVKLDFDQLTELSEEQRGDFTRELNLSWSRELAQDNKIVDGNWWQDEAVNGELLVSIEEVWGKTLGLQVGDQVGFSIGGLEVDATISSFRSVEWQAMKPNFYVLFDQPINQGVGATYLSSFYLHQDDKPYLTELLKQYPTFSLIELDSMIKQVQDIISQVSLAIELILLMVLVAGFLVLIAAIQASLDERFQESAIIRALGGKQKLVLGSLLVEFSFMGALAGLLAMFGAQTVVSLVQTNLLDMPFIIYWWLWGLSPFIGMMIIAVIGLASTHKVVKITPLKVLRNL